jgi:hypothetical protein
MMKIGRQDYRRRKDTAGKTSASRLVAARLYERCLIEIFEHNTTKLQIIFSRFTFFNNFVVAGATNGLLAPQSETMAKKRITQHGLFDLAMTLIIIAIVSTLRAAFLPVGDEGIVNTPTPVGLVLQGLQNNIPSLSVVVWCLCVIVAGLNVGRYAAKYSIYPAYTLMAIPILGVVAAAVMVSGDYLVSSAVLLLMLYAIKYTFRCVLRSKTFGDLSLAMLFYGAIPLIFAPAAVLYVALPVLTLVLYNSWREWVVAVSSLLFPLLAVSYWDWCAGNGFLDSAQLIYSSAMAESGFHLFSVLNPVSILLIGVVVVMVLCSVMLILSDRYSLKVTSRNIMRFDALLLLLSLPLFFMPSVTATAFAFVSLPVAMLVPLMFVRMGVGFTEMLYRIMLLAAAINIVVLCWM